MSDRHAKAYAARVKGAGTASAEQLAAINRFTLRAHTAEEVVVRGYVLAHNGIDRDAEVMDEGLLADFARTLPGKGIFVEGHPSSWMGTGGPAEGKCFAARVEQLSFEAARALLGQPDLQFPPDRQMASVLHVEGYFVPTDANKAFLAKSDAGIGNDVSIGFRCKAHEPIYDTEGRELDAVRLKGPGEAYELSHVWLGAQPGARAVKDYQGREPSEETTMNADQIKALQEKNTELQRKVDEHAKAQGAVDAIRKALGDNAALVDNPAELAKAVADGIARKGALIDELVTAERHAGIVGDKPEDVEAAKALYAGFPVDKLEQLQKRYQATGDATKPGGIGTTAGDPNTPKPKGNGGGETKVPDALDSVCFG